MYLETRGNMNHKDLREFIREELQRGELNELFGWLRRAWRDLTTSDWELVNRAAKEGAPGFQTLTSAQWRALPRDTRDRLADKAHGWFDDPSRGSNSTGPTMYRDGTTSSDRGRSSSRGGGSGFGGGGSGGGGGGYYDPYGYGYGYGYYHGGGGKAHKSEDKKDEKDEGDDDENEGSQG